MPFTRGLLCRGGIVARLMLLGTVLSCVLLSGCVGNSRRSMTQFLPSVPQTWWPGTREEPAVEAEKAEPSVTANVAATADLSEAAAGESSLNSSGLVATKRKPSAKSMAANGSVTAHGGGRATLPPTESERQAAVRALAIANANNAAQPDDGDKQLERLKAALNEDASRTTTSNRAVTATGEVRARVESLLSRARRLFDIGQLADAKQTAQMAQELGESARLDFSPDEERPIDLVRQIDDQLQATADEEAQPEQSKNPVAAVSGSRTTPKSPSTAAPSITAPNVSSAAVNSTTEASNGRSWLRSRAINVFRREPKPVVNDSIPATLDTFTDNVATATQDAAGVHPNSIGGAKDDSEASSDIAVVQANRSVALARRGRLAQTAGDELAVADTNRAQIEFVSPASSSFARDDDALSTDRTQDNEASHTRHTDAVSDAAFAVRNNSVGENDRQLPVDDAGTTPPGLEPPALEEVRPMSPFRNLARAVKIVHPERAEQRESRLFAAGWAIASAVLIVGSLLAITCYRR